MAKIDFIFTLDYEMPVSRPLDVMRYMVWPTDALLSICRLFGAKLTIMVEIAELWALESMMKKERGKKIAYKSVSNIKKQLISAIKMGHDVQMHLHPQWLGAKWSGLTWQLDYSKYRITDLEYKDLVKVFCTGKKYLERLLGRYCENYSCIGFRAGHWITQPSKKYLSALHEAGLKSDISVFKWGFLDKERIYFDYRNAHSNVMPWISSWDDINKPGKNGSIIVFPIYSEPSSLFRMLSAKRILLAYRYFLEERMIARSENMLNMSYRNSLKSRLPNISRLFNTYPKKFDFCKLTTLEMFRMIEHVGLKFFTNNTIKHVPIVAIGHSKEPLSCVSLIKFFKMISTSFGDSIRFVTYRDAINEYQGQLSSD